MSIDKDRKNYDYKEKENYSNFAAYFNYYNYGFDTIIY